SRPRSLHIHWPSGGSRANAADPGRRPPATARLFLDSASGARRRSFGKALLEFGERVELLLQVGGALLQCIGALLLLLPGVVLLAKLLPGRRGALPQPSTIRRHCLQEACHSAHVGGRTAARD